MTQPIKVTVEVAPDELKLGKQEAALWETVGNLYLKACNTLGSELAVSIMLSRIGRELRRLGGPHLAQQVFQGMADTMHDAAHGDDDNAA